MKWSIKIIKLPINYWQKLKSIGIKFLSQTCVIMFQNNFSFYDINLQHDNKRKTFLHYFNNKNYDKTYFWLTQFISFLIVIMKIKLQSSSTSYETNYVFCWLKGEEGKKKFMRTYIIFLCLLSLCVSLSLILLSSLYSH